MAEAPPVWQPRHNPWLITLTVMMAVFMEVLDTSIANIALPHIAGGLSATPEEATWVLTSYLVSNAIILPMTGWLGNYFGRKRVLISCIVMFTIASALCGLAWDLPTLVIARILQGFGGGAMVPIAQAIMLESFPPQKRGVAMALFAQGVVVAPILGPTIGGWITDNYSWRWIFYINLPVGILAFVLVSRLVQDPPWIKPDRANLRKLDYIGLGLLSVAMGGLQIMLDKGEENDWFASSFIRIFCLLFVVGMIGLIWWQWRAKNPIMNLRLFKYKNFAICCFLMILVGGVLNAATVLEPQFLQQLMGYTATRAGEALAGGGLTLLVIMPLAGAATGKFPARNMAAFGFACFAGAFYYTSTHFTLTMTFGFASWLRILQMFAIPFAFIAITTAAYVGLPKEASNQVAGIINFVRNVGGSIFIAVTGAIVTNRSLFHQAHLQEHMRPGDPAFVGRVNALTAFFGGTGRGPGPGHMARTAIYQQLIQQAAAMAYQDIYRLLSWMALGLVICAFILSKNKHGQGAPAGEAMH